LWYDSFFFSSTSALRRLTTFVVIAGQYLILKKTVSSSELYSVILMVIGAFIASYGDISFDLYGYLLTGLNCIVTAAYLILIAKSSRETGLNTFSLMYYNNILSIPFVTLIVFSTEMDLLKGFPLWFDIGFQFCFWMSVFQAFALNYLVFLCSIVNSPLATSITGQLKSIIQTVLGLFLFGGVIITTPLSIGLLISTFGGIWYGYIKYNEQVKINRETPSSCEIQEMTSVKVSNTTTRGTSS